VNKCVEGHGGQLRSRVIGSDVEGHGGQLRSRVIGSK
jgi:hypothetical protein